MKTTQVNVKTGKRTEDYYTVEVPVISEPVPVQVFGRTALVTAVEHYRQAICRVSLQYQRGSEPVNCYWSASEVINMIEGSK